MAFSKTASAQVAKPIVNWNYWRSIRTAGNKKAVDFKDILPDFSPERYLLSHCTIIASVDVDEKGPKNKKGWAYYITPETSKFLNNNGDSWERDLLLATYHTFIGSENYQEHIQIKELSKGKIIDAVARNIGESIYVDILVATDRKHEELVRDIISGKMSTLSMGCTVNYTLCTKCGNVAKDETELCQHIKYYKGSHFVDENGVQRIVGELCGHKSDPASVKFIEASWVAEPAFTGAVLNKILTTEEVADIAAEPSTITAAEFDIELGAERPDMLSAMMQFAKAASRMEKLLERIGQSKMASDDLAAMFGEEAPADDPAPEAEEEPKDELAEVVDKVKKEVTDRAVGDLSDQIRDKKEPEAGPPRSEDMNEELVKSKNDVVVAYHRVEIEKGRAYTDFKKKYANRHPFIKQNSAKLFDGIWRLAQAGGKYAALSEWSGRDILALDWFLENFSGRTAKYKLANEHYKAIASVGGTRGFSDPRLYLAAIKGVLGRPLTKPEAEALIVKGRIYSVGRG